MDCRQPTGVKGTIVSTDNLSIYILHFEPGWIAVEKPAGMSVHNDHGRDLCSSVADFMHASLKSHSTADGEKLPQVHPVHRIDRHTSGVVLMSFRPDIHRILSSQFGEGSMEKEYIAVLHGSVAPVADGKQWGLWRWELSKEAAGRNNPQGAGPRAACMTRYRILDHSRHYTLVACLLQTGRKHQIRRHAKLAGHPVVGDTRYGSLRSSEYLQKAHNFSRLGLHADRLIIYHPESGDRLAIQSSGLPKSLHNLFWDDVP